MPLGLAPQPGRATVAPRDDDGDARADWLRLGMLPLARRDLERLRQMLGLQRRLRDLTPACARSAR